METRGPAARRGLIALVAALLATAAMSMGAAAVSVGQDPGAVCVGGWVTAGSPSVLPGSTAVDAALQDGVQWVAGSAMVEGRRLVASTARSSSNGWISVPLAPTNDQELLTGLATDGPHGLWTVGERVGGGTQTEPLIEHWNGRTWKHSQVPMLAFGGALSDVTQPRSSVALAVGFGADLKGQHAVAYVYSKGHWTLDSPKLVGLSALTAISSDPGHMTWAVGWTQEKTGYRPLLERWNGHGWTRSSMSGDGSIVLTGVDVVSANEAWAVGFREVGGSLGGIVAHWDGHAWSLVPDLTIPALGGSILRDVTVANGHVTAVGMSWNRSSSDSLALVVQQVGTTWTVNSGVAGITGGELLGISGGAHPVAVGRDGTRAVAIVPCVPGHAPSGDDGSIAAAPTAGDAAATAQGESPRGSRAAGRAVDGARAAVDASLPGIEAARLPHQRSPRRRQPRPSPSLSLPAAHTIPGLQVKDVTAHAGLTMTTLTYNGMAADLNGDGWQDLVIGRHAHPLWVLLNQGNGTFKQPFANGYRQADRHGCAVGDIDSDPLPEIVCAVGANHGLSIKDNEVWLDPLDPDGKNAADALGLADPLDRGRRTALLDYNHDGKMDVYFGSDPSRPDALPGSNHLFRNVNGSSFVPAPEAGLDLGVGAQCLIPVDIDGDGWTDLIDCEYIQMAAYTAMHIFHNDHGVFHDVTAKLGVSGSGVFDAVTGDLNHDGKVDLVTLSPNRLSIWLQHGGTFHLHLVMSVPDAAAVTLADVNGDKSPDIYVVRGTYGGGPVQDVLLLNDGTATHLRSVKLPNVQPGPGGDAFPVDYDHNGKQDILVMHGSNREEGPIQLLAFGPPWPAGESNATPGVSPSPSAVPSPLGSPSPTAAAPPSGGPSPTAVPLATPSPTPVRSPSAAPSPTPGPSASVKGTAPVATPSPSLAASPTPSAVASRGPSPNPSSGGPSPSAQSTNHASPSPPPSPSPSPVDRPSPSPQATAVAATASAASPPPSAPATAAPSANGVGAGTTGAGSTDAGSGSASSGSALRIAGLDETNSVRAITLAILGVAGLLLFGWQLLGRRDRGR